MREGKLLGPWSDRCRHRRIHRSASCRRRAPEGRHLDEVWLATTAITLFEIWKGLETDSDPEVARRAFRGVRVYPLGDAAARRAAEAERSLRRTPIGDRDILIAGVSLTIQRPLLTANLRHFQRVPGLEVLGAR